MTPNIAVQRPHAWPHMHIYAHTSTHAHTNKKKERSSDLQTVVLFGFVSLQENSEG